MNAEILEAESPQAAARKAKHKPGEMVQVVAVSVFPLAEGVYQVRYEIDVKTPKNETMDCD